MYVSRQQPDSAYSCFVQSYKAEPVNDMTLTNLTIVCTILNKSDEVIFYGKEAINNQLANQKIYLNMATAYQKLNNIQEANKYQSLANTTQEHVLVFESIKRFKEWYNARISLIRRREIIDEIIKAMLPA